MVARQATFSSAQQALVKLKEHQIDLIDIVSFMYDKIFDDNIEFAASGQCISGSANEILSIIQIKLQSYSKCQGSCFGRFVSGIVLNFREQLTVDIGLLVYFRILLSGFVNKLDQPVRKACIQFL